MEEVRPRRLSHWLSERENVRRRPSTKSFHERTKLKVKGHCQSETSCDQHCHCSDQRRTTLCCNWTGGWHRASQFETDRAESVYMGFSARARATLNWLRWLNKVTPAEKQENVGYLNGGCLAVITVSHSESAKLRLPIAWKASLRSHPTWPCQFHSQAWLTKRSKWWLLSPNLIWNSSRWEIDHCQWLWETSQSLPEVTGDTLTVPRS